MAQAAVGTVSNLQSREPGPEVLEKVDKVIEAYRGKDGALIPVLHEVQQIAGYLPRCVLRRIARGLAVPESEVYGVVTFYSLFTMTPAGRHKIGVCMGTACYVKGAAALLEAVRSASGAGADGISHDGRFSLEVTRCVGACGLAPVLSVDGEIYSRVEPEAVPAILERYP